MKKIDSLRISKVAIISVSLLFLSACSTNNIENMPRDARVKFALMRAYSDNKFDNSTVIGEVLGLSCARQLGKTLVTPLPGGSAIATSSEGDITSESDAIQDMRYKAAMMGGDAIVNVVCKSGGVDWIHNCWSTVKCVGDVIKK
ncbi:hypothetical protein ACI28F_005119 [Escherichia coli]|jgi:uncharacterized protein YbjQ (UPF0145 family)|uniref:Uncharacterized protein n=2 Tax=Escherichia coli TaxID=562 RepID=A0A8S7NSB0_ECOLX|nr:hypothetical protein [Escherichia coli]EEV2856340.1 hypothetical protein [Escherichia coli O145]EFB4121964.1 hypothetical protein [Escherichia coli O5]EJE8709837.1 hypothetical protein [Shigella sonnei]HBC2972502.1 hypothetical protein [Escherichia coli O146]HDQ6614589.1 hypothetical protein [Escherichia coli O87:H16]HDQ6624072.1 hypothetical protein [Escherichia coli O128:H2]HDQ6665485.1 hypothetical protein [Escherichia coli O166:H28]HDQ6712928.1 hypothetical protein [Escherichia coli 